MATEEVKILERKKFYVKRRNNARRIFLVVFLFCYLFFLYKVFLLPKNASLKIEVVNNNLIDKDFIVQAVLNHVSVRDYFLVSPRKISNELVESFSLLRNAVIRKYLIPYSKIFVFVKEKKLWSRLIVNKREELKKFDLITEDGDIVPPSYLNLNLLPQNLLPIYTNSRINKKHLLLLKNVLDMLRKEFKFNVSGFFVTKAFDLEIHSIEGFRIKAGKIDNEIIKRVSKLKDIIALIKARDYVIEYLDLTLEGGAVFKKYAEDKKKLEFNLFKRRKM